MEQGSSSRQHVNRCSVVSSSCVARISQRGGGGGGLFRKLETKVNKLDSNYHQSQVRSRRFSAQNQVISKKKKVLLVHLGPLSLVDITSGSSPTLTSISFGGGYFRFLGKNQPQSCKKYSISHTFQPNGGYSTICPPP